MKNLKFEDGEESCLWQDIVRELVPETVLDTEETFQIADEVIKAFRKRNKA